MRDVRILLATLTAATLALTACGGDDSGGGGDDGGSDEGPGTSQEESAPDTWPLTGLEVKGNDSSEQTHPVLVAKIDNSSSSSPQLGLGSADLVVEELVEGGTTRLAAFFYSEIPGNVGPIRSMRASDIGIVSPVDATVVTSGAAAVTIKRINDAGIPYVAEGGAGFYRDDARSAPYNLFTDMSDVAGAAETKATRPDDYLPWGSAGDLPDGEKASTLTADFGSQATTWSYADGGYVNESTYAGDGDEFPADSVLVLRVEIGDAGYKDPAGNPVPETNFEGEGEAMLFHDGKVVTGTWAKDGLDSSIELSTEGGDLKVPAGHVWIELVPVDSANGSVTYGK